MDLGLKDKVVIVTGGAKGVGAGICEAFAEEKAKIVVDFRSDAAQGEAFARSLRSFYQVEAVAVQADVSKEADVVALFSKAVEAFGTVDIVINNAATWTRHLPIEDYSPLDYQRASAANVESVMLTSRELVRLAKSTGKKAHILNVLTKSVFWSSSINNSTYVATKGAVTALTRNLAHEVGKDGIFVNAIVPGYVWNSTMDPDSERYKRTLSYIPNRTMATPREMGWACAFLCSERASQINGAVLDCSGGTMNGHGPDAICPET
ncbi:SDR family oxidoreductase [Oscillibacter sp. MSJ-2]|uniref:SDR family oxidoreductase n=1 Tax=Dysosmobacter acutus TaxID=2841504 RepID=A0ABS6FBN7_9FIRM|nr:SDR family oxidoreductase [Dysosmobacter acutus]MBU5626754.1 SDR family oxidoreductase [Dysosmobacter acutus]